MKKYGRVLMLASAISLFAVASSSAQVIVRARLGRPRTAVVVRPARPTPRHVWVSEEWAPSGRTYVYRQGYWAQPPRPRAVWVEGRWRHSHRGYVWVNGYWR
ncbi:hypothetical protein [Mucilaginibacter sp.]|uniref:hypothetical protein n=1 Tax=Mucilaginibacter sp. TaxID=1882438 RepID=UPI0026196698|nr:hypothetical protein [Mucilaginibacter sp.]MDB4920878.1 hypothetical protein [Mucilaginibacter sp.]